MCKSLKTTTKAVGILKQIGDFFGGNSLSWNHVGSLCTAAILQIGAKADDYGWCSFRPFTLDARKAYYSWMTIVLVNDNTFPINEW